MKSKAIPTAIIHEKFAVKDIAGILIGSTISAAAIQGILVPAHLLTGGIAGLALILNFITDLDIWIWYVGLNLPIFIAGYRFISLRFIVYSLLGVLFSTMLLALFKGMDFGIDNILLAAVFGGR